MPVIIGTAGDDVLNGTTDDDTIYGNGGTDTITANAGNDTVVVVATIGTFGSLDGGTGLDTVQIDRWTTPTAANGSAGTYSYSEATFGNSTINSFERLVFNTQTSDFLQVNFSFGGSGGSPTNHIGSGLSADAEIVGGAGTDVLGLSYYASGTPGSVTLPTFTYTNWSTPVRPYQPADQVAFFVVGSGATNISGASHSGILTITGGSGNDVITGTDGIEVVNVSSGNDTVNAGAGSDALAIVNTYYNRIFAGPGSESTLTGAGTSFNGGDGTDFLILGGHVNALAQISSVEGVYLLPGYFNANSGFGVPPLASQYDTVATFSSQNFSALPSNLIVDGIGTVVVNLADGGGAFDGSSITFEPGSDVKFQIFGGTGNDTLTGTTGQDQLIGGDGADTLNGGGDINVLSGGDGNDRLIIGTGASGSSVDGGTGTDTLEITSATSLGALAGVEAVELSGGGSLTLTGSQFATGLAVTSALSGTGTITINMTAGVDYFSALMTPAVGSNVTFTVNGTSGSDQIKGGQFATTVNGGDGADVIRTGNLVDTIKGGIGDDKIAGRGGSDILTGAAGSDTFRYVLDSDSGLGVNADHITDFAIGTDKLAFRALDPDLVTPGIQAFAFIDSQAFHATGAAEIHYANSGADLLVEADLNGDGIADMQIVLNGLAGQVLTSGDFLL